MPGTFDSVLTVASAENEGVKWFFATGVLGWYNKRQGSDQYMNVSEIENVPEGKGFCENLKPTEDLVKAPICLYRVHQEFRRTDCLCPV